MSIIKTLLTVTFIALSIWIGGSFASAQGWPENDSNCKNKGKGFEKSCTLTYKYLAINPSTGAESVVYKNSGTQFKSSQIKKAYAKQGLVAEKKDLTKGEKFVGLRDVDGRVLLETIYDVVYTVSTTHSLVRLKDGKTLKFAEHGTHKLTDLPSEYPVRGFKLLFDPKLKLNRQVIWMINYHDKKNHIAHGGRLQPDLTLSPILKNINSRIGLPIPFGNKYAIPIHHPATGNATYMMYDFNGKLLDDNFQFQTLKVQPNLYRVGSKVPSHRVVQIGEAPRSIRLDDRRLYWPIDKYGELIPRPDNIMGVLPVFSKEKDINTGWLTVIKSADGYDYTLGSLDKDSRPDKIAADLDSLLLLDEIEFYSDSETYYKGEKFGARESIVVKPKRKNGQPSLWYEPTYVPGAIKPSHDFEKNNMGNTPLPKGSTTARGARLALKNHYVALRKKYAKQNEEKAAFDKVAATRAWKNPTRYARECMSEYANIKRIQVEGWRGKNTDGDLSWAMQYEFNKGKPCDQWPSNRGAPSATATGEQPYTLQEGLEDIARAAACTTQEYKCTYIGNGKESCSWVTKTVC